MLVGRETLIERGGGFVRVLRERAKRGGKHQRKSHARQDVVKIRTTHSAFSWSYELAFKSADTIGRASQDHNGTKGPLPASVGRRVNDTSESSPAQKTDDRQRQTCSVVNSRRGSARGQHQAQTRRDVDRRNRGHAGRDRRGARTLGRCESRALPQADQVKLAEAFVARRARTARPMIGVTRDESGSE